eukprot:CAMPEP_0184297362 /NCGR_PEP_ID=MMETSP1049-20130417/8289_1 /TAXON_ID=77928 /ORGANISM="Proteomonas sulcata, Strain CCMP704" /LENGTH=64 /DNA_ID=CAMNT_0026607063 /DNA_START=626 /DNA_END=820 /DNA_ORIENTATION=+
MGFFNFPKMDFPSMHMPKMHFPKIKASDFAGGKASMSTSEFHCVNGVCDGKSVTGNFTMPTKKH